MRFFTPALRPLRRHGLARMQALALFAALSLWLPFSLAAERAHDDMARYLAGLAPATNSPLATFAQEPAWSVHAQELDAAWSRLERVQLSRVRPWSATHLSSPRPTLLYLFSGPDYLYARSFFPQASTYVLAGLETPGAAPDLAGLTPEERQRGLDTLRASMKSLLNAGFFITANMQKDLHGSGFTGVLPVLYVFLARSGMEIREVSALRLLDDGSLETVASPSLTRPSGIRIRFHDRELGANRTLYYFSVDLSNTGLGTGAFLKFLEQQGPSDALIKSASYLMHTANFSRIRDAILARSERILQDDTGVKLDDYDRAVWQVTPFGRYTRPIQVFDHMYQPSMTRLFQEGSPAPLGFRLGYGFSVDMTGLLIAVRR